MEARTSSLYRKVLQAEILFALATTEGITSSPRIALLTDAAALLDGKRLPKLTMQSSKRQHSPDWATPGEIGDTLNVPPGVVGRCLKLAGLHGSQDKDHKWSKVNGVHGNAQKQYLYDRSVVSAVVAAVYNQQEVFELAARCRTARQ